MHLLRLLATMSSVDAGWTRPIISLAVTENTTIDNNSTAAAAATTTTTTHHCNQYRKILLISTELADYCFVETGST